MASPPKMFLQNFENFKGLDNRSSHLVRAPEAAVIADNIEIGKPWCIKSRRGSKIMAAWPDPAHPDYHFRLHCYKYIDTDGSEKTELLAMYAYPGTGTLYKLNTGYLNITALAGCALTSISIRMRASTGAGAGYTFSYYENGVVALAADVGHGREAAPYDLTALVNAINAVGGADISASLTDIPGTNPAAIIPIIADTTYTIPLPVMAPIALYVIPVYYWTQVLTRNLGTAIAQLGCNAVNHRNCVYFSNRAVSTADTDIFKYDGVRFYRAGLMTPEVSGEAVGGGPGVVEKGIHKWMAIMTYRDAKGNFVNTTPHFNDVLTGFNVTATDHVHLNVTAWPNQIGPTDGAVIHGAHALGARTAVTVHTATNTLRKGDYLTFVDGTTGVVMQERVTSINVGGGGAGLDIVNFENSRTCSLADNDIITQGVYVTLYRTKVGGETFYRVLDTVGTSANNWLAGTATIIPLVDNIADTALGAKYEWTEKDYTMFPALRYLTVHQGLIVGAGDPSNPVTVYFENIETPEGYDPASNSFDVATTGSVGVSALASDTDDMLAVFHKDAYFNVIGDLEGGTFSTTAITSGDFGISGPRSIVKAKDVMLGVGKRGIIAIKAGQMDFEVGRQVSRRFFDRELSMDRILRLAESSAVVDSRKGLVMFSVPSGSIITAGAKDPGISQDSLWLQTPDPVSPYSTLLVLDYNEGIWSEWKPDSYDDFPILGMVSDGTHVFFMTGRNSLVGTKTKPCMMMYFWNEDTYGTGAEAYECRDTNALVPVVFAPQWVDMGEPSVNKMFSELKLYSLETHPSYPLDITVQVYKDWDDSTVVDTLYFNFASASVKECTRKFTSGIYARSLLLKMTSTSLPFILNGFEISIVPEYDKDRIQGG